MTTNAARAHLHLDGDKMETERILLDIERPGDQREHEVKGAPVDNDSLSWSAICRA